MSKKRRSRDETLSAFRFSGGCLSLDFAVTLGDRHDDPIERLDGPEDMGRWLVEAGMVEAPIGVDEAELGVAKGLREAIYGLLAARVLGAPFDRGDLEEVNSWAQRPTRVMRLAETTEGFEVERSEASMNLLLTEIARDAVTLLGGLDAGRLRECQNPTCSMIFLDSSHGGRRRWCSMEGCGNLSKTSRYRRRKEEERKEVRK